MEIVEEFVNGYCRNYDMARSAIAEYIRDEAGLHFDRIDCDYGTCIHSQSCELMKEVLKHSVERI